MKSQPSITNADDTKLVDMIRRASRRVLFLAPGTSQSVAEALRDAWTRLGGESVHVILDVDPEVCRLGYGTLDGLKILRDAAAHVGTLVCHQPGVRIGLLIIDDTTLVYSPTPLLIEAGSQQPQRPNAILLGAPPDDLAKDLGLGPNPNVERIVGLDPVQPAKVQAVADDLANNPAVKFDLARRVRVFTSRFQFVELEMTGCFVSRKRVPIPSRLVGLAKNRDVETQFHAHFNLVNSAKLEVSVKGRKLTEESLRKAKQRITSDFLISLKGYGMVVLRANKEKLIAAIETLRTDVQAFQNGIRADLQSHMEKSAASLVTALLPAVARNPPEAYTKIHGPQVSPDHIQRLLETDIKDAFGKSEALVAEMKVTLIFKDLAYESLVDKQFLDTAREAMPGVEFLHEEYDAAKSIWTEGTTP